MNNKYDDRRLYGKGVTEFGYDIRRELNDEIRAILYSHAISERFPLKVETEAEQFTDKVVLKGRKDYRSLPTVTIDGDDAKDFDDAISVVRTKDEYKLYVHIADVSHYVVERSPIDKEAYNRGTSVYLPGRVYPMLPPKLSNELCSLQPERNRYTLTAIITIDKDGNRCGLRLEQSVICSNYRMTYRDTTALFEGNKALAEKYADILPMLQTALELSKLLHAKRMERGAVDFATRECEISVDNVGFPTQVQVAPYTASNALIEEFMLCANEEVAQFLFEHGYPCVYRVHAEPTEEKLNSLKTYLRSIGIKFKLNSVQPSDFAALIASVKDSPFESAVNKMTLRSMSKACYLEECHPHFGLAADYYCHFTSPIRRYPDLMVHRIIHRILDGTFSDEMIETVGKTCARVANISTMTEREAELAEREADDLFKCAFMEDKLGERYIGTVSGVTNFGLFVELDNTVEGLIPMSSLGRGCVYDEAHFTMVTHFGRFRLGDEIEVVIDSVNSLERRIRFTPYGDEDFAQRKTKKSTKITPKKRTVPKPSSRKSQPRKRRR